MTMRVNVRVRTPGLKDFMAALVVSPDDLVGTVVEKAAASQLLVFPECSLHFGAQKLDTAVTLAVAGVTEGSTLDFVLEANEKTIVKQLHELVKARSLTFDELGLLYCYRHGISLNQALKTLGITGSLKDVLESNAEFIVTGSKVGLAANEERAVAPPPAVAAALQAPTKPAPSKPAPTHALPQNVADAKTKKVKKNKPAASAPEPETVALLAAREDNDAAYQDLHTKVSSRAFHSKISQDLRKLQTVVEESCFLHIEEVVRGGPIGRGTALVGNEDAELVVFVRGLPPAQHDKWLPRLNQAVATSLESKVDEPVVVSSKHVRVGRTTITLSPVFESYSLAVQALGVLGPDSRPYFDASFVKERNSFIGKQPGNVKAVMRLLKWWREQQSFSCDLTRPSDELLELLAIYVAQQCGKQTLSEGVANCMAVMARLGELRAIWTNFYTAQDVWSPLMAQRPLLMDPVNPFRNVMDPQDFDPREVIMLARTTTFW
jgi:hypothetical protein